MLLFICVSPTYIFPFVFLLCLSIFVFYLKCYCSFVFLIFLWFVFLLPICLCIFVFYMCSICVCKYKLNYGQQSEQTRLPVQCVATLARQFTGLFSVINLLVLRFDAFPVLLSRGGHIWSQNIDQITPQIPIFYVFLKSQVRHHGSCWSRTQICTPWPQPYKFSSSLPGLHNRCWPLQWYSDAVMWWALIWQGQDPRKDPPTPHFHDLVKTMADIPAARCSPPAVPYCVAVSA